MRVEVAIRLVLRVFGPNVAMGSPLGPALANIFVGFYESKLFDKISKPQIYYRYVDDTFALFQDEVDSETFLTNLNSLHTSFKFTSEKEVNQSLPFLDVLVTKSTNNFTTSVYRKATFTGEYIRWNSFGPKIRKTNLIATSTRTVHSKSAQNLPSNTNWTLLDLYFLKMVTQNR